MAGLAAAGLVGALGVVTPAQAQEDTQPNAAAVDPQVAAALDRVENHHPWSKVTVHGNGSSSFTGSTG